ncbi:MAG: SDR family oxidoreductase [Leptospiraceae bacterium]|nr:SDR family oxidoreductase [Leptospiraceae bacterium]
MKTAIVTGASSGIGLSIAKRLISLGYLVYGIGRNFSKTKNLNQFIECELDLSDPNLILQKSKILFDEIDSLDVLVHSAGIGKFGLHEELNPKELLKMIQTNFTAPVLLNQLLLRKLKKAKGIIFSISSITAKKNSALAAAYSGTKAGLTQFHESIFEESRKSGLRIVNIHPDITQTNFYEENWFSEESSDPEAFLLPEDIADIVEFSLKQRTEILIRDLTLSPQKHRIKKKTSQKSNILQS